MVGKLCEGPTHAWAGVEAANVKMKMEMEERAAGRQSRRNRLVYIKDVEDIYPLLPLTCHSPHSPISCRTWS